jgi:thiol:disulfide interchange protein DsbD
MGLIVMKASADAPMEASEVTLNITADSANTSASAPATAAAKGGSQSLLAMLGLAFVGGLILNIMPCVLPVIALKILGFVNQNKESPQRVRQLGVVYTLGVLSSFILLAGIVIGVQQAGKAANWGMQFQNAQFLVGMTILVTLVALNLFGVFEVTLGGSAMTAAGALASKEGGAGAFFNGMLATALATPCTAPYLSFALGFAFAQSPAIIVLMFAAIGLGLAAPYLVLSWHPQWLKFLPKPGAWMERFKQAMGFPMLATAIWLFSLTLIHFGESSALWFGVFLVVLAMAAWIWGQFVQRGSRRRGLAMAISFVLMAAAYLYLLEGELHWRKPVLAKAGGEAAPNDPNGIQWRRWSREAAEEARAAGHPVLVDFTAKWCTTCLVNKKTSLEIPAVREKLKSIGGVAFRADYTREDPLITAELKRFERAAVPLVLVFPPDRSQLPILLPEVLRPGLVLDALSKAATTQVAVQSKP